MNDDLIKRLRAAADAVMSYQWSGDRERMAALHELCQAESAAADALEAQAARIAELETANRECSLLLSRVLHELAGAASLCWSPRPTGVFESQEAIKHVEDAIAELRAALKEKQ